VLPRKQKPSARRLTQVLVGMYLLCFIGLYKIENIQLEGFFLYLFSGFFAGSVIHYLIAKILGPVIFNRGYCGWACLIMTRGKIHGRGGAAELFGINANTLLSRMKKLGITSLRSLGHVSQLKKTLS